MAQEKKTIHQYKLSAKLDDGKLTVWVSDAITKKRWESEFNKDSFPGKNLKDDIFPIIKKAVTSKPACWAATYPQQDGENLYIDIEDGALEFELPEVQFDPDDLF
eukprot:CAMPEP_0197024718 /NCGR_PEP_ID=MMETSP1384-20130603/5218_1 /TAXON_ID=29189 /ORGANISM="Ammonia sp." /LENGTH=104 /DNA_ID=CAMNT_0042453147 /DNA_START=57 /DNA_END=371 /DNA_ORIENTATION=-